MSSFRHQSEKIAIDFLKKEGHLILEHNKIINIESCKIEIDIITFFPSKEQIHFIEVKNWNSFFIHPVQREIFKRKEKVFESFKKFIMEIYNNIKIYENKSEYNHFLCLIQNKNLWEISFSYDLIWIQKNKVEIFYNIFTEI